MWSKIKDIVKSKKSIQNNDIESHQEDARFNSIYAQWAKKHIKQWGCYNTEYVFIVLNEERDPDDESTHYLAVYSKKVLGTTWPKGTMCYFSRQELFPYKA